MHRVIPLLPLILLVESCAILPGNWRPSANRQQPDPTKYTQTHANFTVGERERRDGMFLGIAISGGGSRAANFGAAVLLEMKQLGVLDRADFLSAVSGGTLPAAYLALEGYRNIAFERDEVKKRMGRDFQGRWFGRWFLPQNIFRYWLTNFNRTDIMVQVFDNNLFHKATFADLNPERPKLLINATDIGEADSFVFTDEIFQNIGADLRPYLISAAVSASAAFPGVFQNVTLQDFRKTQPPSYYHLFDGGPKDNLGLGSLQTVLRETLRNPPGMSDLFPKGCVLISIDATPWYFNRDLHVAETRQFFDYIIDQNALEAADILLLANRELTLKSLGVAKLGEDRFGEFEINGSENRCRFWHIALRHIPDKDPLGEKLSQIKTKFNIEEEEQNALFEAARLLVQEGWSAKASGWFK